MQPYVVLYRNEHLMAPADAPFSFKCWAENVDHAEEQLLNTDPDAEPVWVVQTENVDAALYSYWNVYKEPEHEGLDNMDLWGNVPMT